MSKMIQIRHVPEELHRKLKARAATTGVSLSDYLLGEIERIAQLPSLEEWMARIAQRTPVRVRESPAAVIRAGRRGR